MKDEPMTIRDIPPGSVFVTMAGVYAVKSEYHLADGRAQCILLESGEYAYFELGDDTPAEIVECPRGLFDAHEHQFQVVMEGKNALRWCRGCGITHILIDYGVPDYRWVPVKEPPPFE